MLINELRIACLELFGLIARAKLTYSQRQQLSQILLREMLPMTLAWWNLPAARQRQLLNQVRQLKADLTRKLPQKQGHAIEAGGADRKIRATQ